MACQARVTDRDLEVEVPDESRLFNLKVLVSGLSREVAVHSTLRKYYLELAPPVIEDQRSDWERLRDAAANVAAKEDFPMTDDRARCAGCAFRRPCGRQ